MLSMEYLLVGGLVGFLSGLLGVGGGGMLVPLLASLFHNQGLNSQDSLPLALGTSLACMIFSSLASLRAHAHRKSVEWNVVFGMAPGILIGALVSSRIVVHIPSTYLAGFFALFMAVAAAQMFLNWRPKASPTPSSSGIYSWSAWPSGRSRLLPQWAGEF